MLLNLSPPGRRRLSALRWLCRAVSPLSDSDAMRADLPPDDLWPDVMALADAHLLLPELNTAVHRHGVASRLPPELVEALGDIFELNRLRNARLRDQMLELCRAFAAEGIAPIWLKGAVELLDAGWESSGRMMSDLDVWIPDPAQQAVALDRMDRLGYRIMPGDEAFEHPGKHHYAGRANDNWPVRIELHRNVIDPTFAERLPDATALDSVAWQDWQGCRVGRLGARERVVQALVQVTAMSVPPLERGRTPLMKGLDVVRRLSADFDGRIPAGLAEELAGPAWDRQIAQFLTIAEHLFGLPNPLATDHRALRRTELATVAPRLEVAQYMAGWLFSRHALSALADPTAIPGVVRRCVETLTSGRVQGR